MIEVRIRHEYDIDAVHLCTWPSMELDQVIPTIKAWGLRSDDQELDVIPELTGTIIYSSSDSYFEVMIHADGDGD